MMIDRPCLENVSLRPQYSHEPNLAFLGQHSERVVTFGEELDLVPTPELDTYPYDPLSGRSPRKDIRAVINGDVELDSFLHETAPEAPLEPGLTSYPAAFGLPSDRSPLQDVQDLIDGVISTEAFLKITEPTFKPYIPEQEPTASERRFRRALKAGMVACVGV